jgi:hypothetical protein
MDELIEETIYRVAMTWTCKANFLVSAIDEKTASTLVYDGHVTPQEVIEDNYIVYKVDKEERC